MYEALEDLDLEACQSEAEAAHARATDEALVTLAAWEAAEAAAQTEWDNDGDLPF